MLVLKPAEKHDGLQSIQGGKVGYRIKEGLGNIYIILGDIMKFTGWHLEFGKTGVLYCHGRNAICQDVVEAMIPEVAEDFLIRKEGEFMTVSFKKDLNEVGH